MISVPGLLRWFTSPSLTPAAYFIRPSGCMPEACGLPHSDIHGSKDMCSSPWPFAACRVLPRLAAPQASAMNLYLPGHIFLPPPRSRGSCGKRNIRLLSSPQPDRLRPRCFSFFPSLLSVKDRPPNGPSGPGGQKLVENRGFEPLTLGLQSRCSSQLS